MQVQFAMVCHEGGRFHNEDIGAIYLPAMLFVVIDGIGGQEGGEIAASMVYEGFQALTHQEPSVDILRSTAEQVNAKIYNRNRPRRETGLTGMGAVATAVWLDMDREVYHLHHVGDAHAYEYLDGQLTQVSDDHSLECVKTLPERERQKHRLKNIVCASYGGCEHFESLQTATRKVESGMTIMICSDGLTDYIDPDLLEAIMSNDMGAQQKAEALYQSAMDADTCDNVTVIIIQITSGEPGQKTGSNSATLCPVD